jgi:hypothetical protein
VDLLAIECEGMMDTLKSKWDMNDFFRIYNSTKGAMDAFKKERSR